jgi:CRISPR-associated exonuclease Cas4
MEQYIQISKINDFLYCPLSLYLHTAYEELDKSEYHETAQVAGTLAHKNIESGTYSSAKRYVQGISVYCEKYNIAGKIDIYDQQEKALIERKSMVKTVYRGFMYQLYAEYFCMAEMGYEVKKLFLHSLSDNHRYEIALPNKEETAEFEKVLGQMRNFKSEDIMRHSCQNCMNNIYSPLAWH